MVVLTETGTFHNIYWDGLTTYDGAFYLFGTIQDARAIFGPGAAIAQLEVTDRWVVAIVGQERRHYETWTAPIP